MRADTGVVRIVRRAALFAFATAAIAGVATGCGSQGARRPPARAVHVAERDFQIRLAPQRVPAGRVQITLHNRGPDRHELLIVRLPSGTLPLRRDGTTVDEEALEDDTVAVIEATEPGSTHVVQARLSPGRYVLFCNMGGHFLGGMSQILMVGRPA